MLVDVAGALYALKRTLRSEVGFFEREFMFRAGQEGAREFLACLWGDALPEDPEKAARYVLELYSQRGYGQFTIQGIDLEAKTIEVSSADSAEAWAFKERRDLQREPVCSYTAGVVSAALSKAMAPWLGDDVELEAFETECVAEGKDLCRFVVAPADVLKKRFPRYDRPKISLSEHELRLNEEILAKNLELQNLNLALERQVRKRTEELWRAEENYRSLMRLSPDPVLIVTMHGRIHSTNAAGLKLLGIESLEDVPEPNLTDFLTDKKSAWERILWMLEKEGAAQGLEVEFTRRDGTKVVGQIFARFADLLPGRCVEAVVKDVTEKKKMEQLVQEARGEKDFLNDLLTHDIMNYMFSSLHFLDRLWKSETLSDKDRQSLGIVMRNIQGAYELASSVRDLARVKDETASELMVRDLKHLIVEAIEDTKRMFPDRKVKIDFDRSMEPKYVRCTALVPRLFTNIFSNAVKFNSSEEALVEVAVDAVVREGRAYWQVRVSDHGRGIPDAEKEKVFTRFHRLDASVPGTGLGLFVARTIAESAGGKIWVEDRVPGDHTQGATLVVLLPKADERDVARMPRRT